MVFHEIISWKTMSTYEKIRGQLCKNMVSMPLTNREIQILQLIIAELTTEEIAKHLSISIATVETHRRHLLRKMGVKSVVGLVKEAIRQNLVS